MSTGASDSLPKGAVTRAITRAQALERAGELVNQVRTPNFRQEGLTGPMRDWLCKPVVRVLPFDLKNRVLLWCDDNAPDLSPIVCEYLYEDKEEWYWEETVEQERVEPSHAGQMLAPKLATIKSVEKKIESEQLRQTLARTRRDISTIGRQLDYVLSCKGQAAEEVYRILDQATSAIVDSACVFREGTHAAEDNQYIFLYIARAAEEDRPFLVEIAGVLDRATRAIEADRQRLDDCNQNIERAINALKQGRSRFGFEPVKQLWQCFLDHNIGIPDALRTITMQQCSGEQNLQLAELEQQYV